MPGLAKAARWEMILLLVGLMVVVLSKAVGGGRSLAGLMTVKGGKDDGSFSPGRAQMMMATLLTAMYYLLQVITNKSTDHLPEVPVTLVGVLGGSQAIYLGGKVQSLWDRLTGKKNSESK